MSGLLNDAWHMEQKRLESLLSPPPPPAVPLESSAGFFLGWTAGGDGKVTGDQEKQEKVQNSGFLWGNWKQRCQKETGCTHVASVDQQTSVSGSWRELCPGSATRPPQERRTSCCTLDRPSICPCLRCCSPTVGNTNPEAPMLPVTHYNRFWCFAVNTELTN